MKRLVRAVALPGLVVALAACSEIPTNLAPTDQNAAAPSAPVLADRADPLALANAGQATAQHLVVFRQAAPADFESQVELLGGRVAFTHPIGVAVVTGLGDEGAAALRADPGMAYVVKDAQYDLIRPDGVTGPTPVELDSGDDPTMAILYAWQWNMRQIHADVAWAAGRLGSPGVTVAILDTGIDYMLPDLTGRVDLGRSVSFVPVDDAYTAYYFPGRHPSTDLHFHGTNVATQVASNAWAFAGVTSRTTLMSVKVCSFLGGCPSVAQGILYAIDQGADVINMSLGGSFAKSEYPGAVSFYNRIMNYAKQKGVTVVVSAGNDAADLQHNQDIFKTYCDATQVVCVAATRLDDEPASYTNYGRSAIDVAAPGGDGATEDWVYALCPRTSLYFNCSGGYFALGVAGTSQAAPHVSGLAALAVEELGRSPARVSAYIRNSADAMGGGNTPYFGKGRINVARAVGAM